MEISQREEDQKNIINLLENVLEQARNGDAFDKMIIICRYENTQYVSVGCANVSTYDFGGMITNASIDLAKQLSEPENTSDENEQ